MRVFRIIVLSLFVTGLLAGCCELSLIKTKVPSRPAGQEDVIELAVAPLSRLSLENGNRPVEVPDFTRGAWQKVKGYKHHLK